MNGVDAAVVDRANYLVDISAKGEDLATACAKISKNEEDELKDAVSVRLAEYEQSILSLYKEEIARLFLIQDFRNLFAGVNGSQEARKILAKLLGATEN